MASPRTRSRQETVDDLLVAAGLGPYEAAKRANIAAQTLWCWRRGVFKRPQVGKVASLAKVLGVDTKRLLKAIIPPTVFP